MKLYTLIFIVLIFVSLSISKEIAKDKNNNRLLSPDSTWTEIKQDSTKYIYRLRNDSLFIQVIDIRPIEDKKFDNSFNVIAVLISKYTKPILKPQIVIKWNDLYINFNKEDLIRTALNKTKENLSLYKDMPVIDLSETDEKPNDNGFNDIIDLESKSFVTDTIEFKNGHIPFYLLKNTEFDISIDSIHIDKVIIEEYETSFSSGTNYYFMDIIKDTVKQYHIMNWIK